MIIDFHTHAFPPKISERALSVLSKNCGGAVPFTDGTADNLIRSMDKSGVDKSVVLNIATSPKQMNNVNNFAALINGERLISFGSVHPDAPDVLDELHRISEMGLKGVKFHPEYQGFFVDEERMIPIYEECDKLGLIVSFHAGADVGYPNPVHCTPQRLARVLPAFTKGRVVAAHFGGYILWDDVERYLAGQNLYIDTSYSYGRIIFQTAKAIVKKHGSDKILFGSDLPWSAQSDEIRLIDALDISDEEKQQILGGNAARLLEI